MSAEQALEEKLVATLEPVTGRGQCARLGDARLRSGGDRGDPGELRSGPDGDALDAAHRADDRARSRWRPGFPARPRMRPTRRLCRSIRSRRTPPQTAKTESGTYGASKTVRHVVEDPGKVRRLTAAIVVNDRLAQPAAKGKAAHVAAALGRRAAQPDRAGAGGGGLRRGARRHADGRGSGLRRQPRRSRGQLCRTRC